MSKKRKRPKSPARYQARQLRRQLDEAVDHLMREDYARVIDICEAILSHPAAQGAIRAEALEYLAHALIMLKRFEEAYQALSQALRLHPKEAHLWYNRSMAAVFSGRSGRALRDIRRAQSLEGKSDCLPQPQNNLGVCLHMQGRYDEAQAAFRRALELDPDYELAQKHLDQLDQIRKTGKTPKTAIFALRGSGNRYALHLNVT